MLCYQTFTCRACTIGDKGSKDYLGEEYAEDASQIHGRCAAIPTILPTGLDMDLAKGYTCWGYTSVPPEAVAWWKALPNTEYRCKYCAKRINNFSNPPVCFYDQECTDKYWAERDSK